MTLLFLNKGPYGIGVLRFDPDGLRGPTPGAVGVGRGKQISFMPGDSKRGVPQFVDVEWSIETPEIKKLRAKRDQDFTYYSKSWIEEIKRINALNSNLIRRIDLAPILTPELLAKARANPGNVNLKLTVAFKGEDVTITAEPEVWRK